MHPRFTLTVASIAVLTLAACGGNKPQTAAETTQSQATTTSVAGGTQTPDAGGRVITVETASDEKGNYFSPKDIDAKVGDVVRFTLKTGVHNVHFLADSNPGKPGLPAASELLQLPGQTYDVKVAGPFTAGNSYYFQCDPHALLGMVGHLRVAK